MNGQVLIVTSLKQNNSLYMKYFDENIISFELINMIFPRYDLNWVDVNVSKYN